MQSVFRRTIAFFVSTLLILSLFLLFNVEAGRVSAAEFSPEAIPYVDHDCIRIEGDAQFLVNATAEGWLGDGSEGNPYVISGYKIDAHGAYNCIFISNVSYHITIRDCWFLNTTYLGNIMNNGAGVTLYDVTDSTIERVLMNDKGWVGLNIINGDRITIRDNVLENRSWAIDLVSSNESAVIGNRIMNAAGGALVQESYGFPTDRGFGSNNNTFEDNIVENASWGFISWWWPTNSYNVLRNNTFIDCDRGMYVAHFNHSLVQGNSFMGGDFGIWNYASLSNVNNNTFEHNVIQNTRDNGVYLNRGHDNVFHDNLIANSGTYGMNLTGCSGNLIYRNVFMNNNGSGAVSDPLKMQAFDDSNDNQWFSAGIGNYWSDWTSPDSDHDGIVDVEYSVGGDNTYDYFPLTAFVEAPTNLEYTTGEAWVDLDWDAPSLSLVSDVKEYVITRISGPEVTQITVPGTETSYNDTNVVSWQEYTYSVVAVNSVGESAPTDPTTVLVPDETAPTVEIISPEEGAHIDSSDVTVEWLGTDGESGLKNFTVRLDGNDSIDVATLTSYVFTSLIEGEHSVTVRAFDNAGNNRSEVVSFVVDTTAPTVSSKTPTGEGVLVDSVVTVAFSEPMNKTSVIIALSGGVTGAVSWNGNVATFDPISDLAYATEYTVEIEGDDLAGNPLALYSWSFNTTDTGIIVGVVEDSEGNPIAGADVALETGENATTDSDGRFSMRAPPGSNILTISKDGYNDEVLDVIVLTGESEDVGTVAMEKSSDQTVIIAVIAILAVFAVGIVAYIMMKRRK